MRAALPSTAQESTLPEHGLYPCLDPVEKTAGFRGAPTDGTPWHGKDEYDQAIGALAATSLVTTTCDDSRPAATAVTTVMSISSEPPIIGAALSWHSSVLANIRTTRLFCVNVLRPHAHGIVRTPGGDNPGEFDDVPWQCTGSGVPWLPTLSFNALECRLISEVPVGDHALLLGEVVELHFPPRHDAEGQPGVPRRWRAEEDAPLVYRRQAYRRPR
jgi:flavin reductase (DIM6/NTAB) family NADH-FMN oxidoreductase RutF